MLPMNFYPEMDELFKHFGYSNMHMGTVEGDFSIESFLDKLKSASGSYSSGTFL